MSNTNDDNTLTSAEVEYLNELGVWGGTRSRPQLLTQAAGRADPSPGDLAQLRWLLAQSSGTIADVAHRLETRGADIDDGDRERLRDDVVALDHELATVKALLIAPVDWDAEYGHLLAGEIPPFDEAADDKEDE